LGKNGNITLASLFIRIENVNEYAPEFSKDLYTFNVDENSPFNTTIAYIKADDKDTFIDYRNVTYKLRNGQNIFEIDKITGRLYTIATKPHQQLDRESIDTFYMTIDATDGGGLTASVQLIIKLNDLNDNEPQFLNTILDNKISFNNITTTPTIINNLHFNNNEKSSIYGYIEENTNSWLMPIRLEAIDKDIGNNGIISFNIIGGDKYASAFTINNKTNHIVLKPNRTLDFEEIHQYKRDNQMKKNPNLNRDEIDINIVVMATDMGNPSLDSIAFVTIIVKDLNDNYPLFNDFKRINSNYSNFDNEAPIFEAFFQIEENMKIKTIISQLNATDNDKDHIITYKMTHSTEDQQYLGLNQLTGELYVNNNIDYEQIKWINFTVIAFDNGLPFQKHSLAHIYCKIIDLNDNKPIFNIKKEQQDIEFNIYEDTEPSTVITKLEATDLDSQQFGVVNYAMISGDENVFSIDSQTVNKFTFSLVFLGYSFRKFLNFVFNRESCI
jgi:hypothetical protein